MSSRGRKAPLSFSYLRIISQRSENLFTKGKFTMSGTTCLSSDFLIEDSQIYVGRGTLNAVTTVCTTPGTTTTLLIYDTDEGAPAGKLLFATVLNDATTLPAAFNLAVRCEKGLYASLTGDGGYIVYYGA